MNIRKLASAAFAVALLCHPLAAQDGHEAESHEVHEHAAESHEGHDQAEESHDGHDHGEESHEDHDEEGHEGHDHSGHAHGNPDEATLSPEAIRISGIATEVAWKRVLSEVATVPARVEYDAESMAHVGTTVPGRVAEIAVRLGDKVKEGDLLLVIESPALGEAESDFLQKRSAVEAARIDVDAARIVLERAEKLREANGVSVTDLLGRQGDFRKAEAALKIAEAAQQAAENRLHILGLDQGEVDALASTGEVTTRFELRAPIAGQVIEREVTRGEVVDVDRHAMAVIADLSTLWIVADVPERLAPRVRVGSKGVVSTNFVGAARVEATVDYVAPQLDARTRTAQARLPVEAAGTKLAGVLRPGMFAQVDLELGGADGDAPVLAVLEEAVQTLEGAPCVFVPVAGKPGAYARRALVVGPRVGKWLPVVSGIAEGDTYVAKGSFVLKAELGKEGVVHEH